MKAITRQIKLLLLFIAISSTTAFANNIAVSNIHLTGQNKTNHFTLVQFDISWDNSWRVSSGPSNWDAAWVFVKYRVKTQTDWHHATLNYTDGTGSGDGHTEPSGSNIASSDDNGAGGAYGVFIYANADEAGSVSYSGAKLRWNYGTDGLGDDDSVEVCVYAVEMVYVPQGSFYVGDGTTTTIRGQFESGTSGAALQITSEGELTLGGGSAGSLGNNNTSGEYTADDFNDATSKTLYTAFPKGYDAFYCMKYEISQAQYTAFLNKLTTTQDGNRFPNQNGNYRHAITGSAGARTTSNPYVACNYLTWADVAAYLDWAALRPMTELEYEKACRGTLSPVADEYAWGSTSVTGATGISNDGQTNETASNAGANSVYNISGGVQGPMRVGCLGQSVNTRQGVGATYYGIMEMSGNLWERAVTVGNTTGRAFTGANGDGVLDANGDANTTNWPGTTATGAGFRGGDWAHNASYLRVSDRIDAAYTISVRYSNYGGRGVRQAPAL